MDKIEFIDVIEIEKKQKHNPNKSLIILNYLFTFNLYIFSILIYQNIFIKVFLILLINSLFLNIGMGKINMVNVLVWNILLSILLILTFPLYSFINIMGFTTLFINFIYMRETIKRLQ